MFFAEDLAFSCTKPTNIYTFQESFIFSKIPATNAEQKNMPGHVLRELHRFLRRNKKTRRTKKQKKKKKKKKKTYRKKNTRSKTKKNSYPASTTSSENKSHQSKKTCERPCPSISKGDD